MLNNWVLADDFKLPAGIRIPSLLILAGKKRCAGRIKSGRMSEVNNRMEQPEVNRELLSAYEHGQMVSTLVADSTMAAEFCFRRSLPEASLATGSTLLMVPCLSQLNVRKSNA